MERRSEDSEGGAMRMAEGDWGREGWKAMWSSTPSRRCVPAWAPKSTASSGLDHTERRAMQRRQGRVATAHEWGDEPPAPAPAPLLDPSAVA